MGKGEGVMGRVLKWGEDGEMEEGEWEFSIPILWDLYGRGWCQVERPTLPISAPHGHTS